MSEPIAPDARAQSTERSKARPRRAHSRKARLCASSQAHREKMEKAGIPDREEIAAALLKHIIDHLARGSENALREATRALQKLPEKYDQDAALNRLKAMAERVKVRQRSR